MDNKAEKKAVKAEVNKFERESVKVAEADKEEVNTLERNEKVADKETVAEKVGNGEIFDMHKKKRRRLKYKNKK